MRLVRLGRPLRVGVMLAGPTQFGGEAGRSARLLRLGRRLCFGPRRLSSEGCPRMHLLCLLRRHLWLRRPRWLPRLSTPGCRTPPDLLLPATLLWRPACRRRGPNPGRVYSEIGPQFRFLLCLGRRLGPRRRAARRAAFELGRHRAPGPLRTLDAEVVVALPAAEHHPARLLAPVAAVALEIAVVGGEWVEDVALGAVYPDAPSRAQPELAAHALHIATASSTDTACQVILRPRTIAGAAGLRLWCAPCAATPAAHGPTATGGVPGRRWSCTCCSPLAARVTALLPQQPPVVLCTRPLVGQCLKGPDDLQEGLA
mmetsp:Transcript_84730/g.265048  ORF Transcript_84730/g.265048 Transcript_84730/m.265048 type:complete len:314 (+) Transcript_84730:405-1346(+)